MAEIENTVMLEGLGLELIVGKQYSIFQWKNENRKNYQNLLW